MLASGVLLGVAAGWLFGGRLPRLADLRIEWWPLLAGAVALRIVAPAIGEPFLAYIAAFLAIAGVAVLNRSVLGMWPIALGAGFNLLVVLLNGAMPVDPTAVVQAGTSIAVDGLHRELRDGDALAILADRIPVPPIARVYSAGDVLLAIGGFWVPFASMRRA